MTIGYLITEAETIWLTTPGGRLVPAHPLAIDQESGLGLVQALDRLGLPAIPLGQSRDARVGDPVVIASGGRRQFVEARIVAKHEFAGYWEYFLDEAIFTAPAHPFWGGARTLRQRRPAYWDRIAACRKRWRTRRAERRQHGRAD